MKDCSSVLFLNDIVSEVEGECFLFFCKIITDNQKVILSNWFVINSMFPVALAQSA